MHFDWYSEFLNVYLCKNDRFCYKRKLQFQMLHWHDIVHLHCLIQTFKYEWLHEKVCENRCNQHNASEDQQNSENFHIFFPETKRKFIMTNSARNQTWKKFRPSPAPRQHSAKKIHTWHDTWCMASLLLAWRLMECSRLRR